MGRLYKTIIRRDSGWQAYRDVFTAGLVKPAQTCTMFMGML